MPKFRIIPGEEARLILRRPDVTLYMEELRKHKDHAWVVAELAEGESKDLIKRVIRRAANNLHVDVEFGHSPPRAILFRT